MSADFIKRIPRRSIGNGEMAIDCMGEIWLAMHDNPDLPESAAIMLGIGKAVKKDVGNKHKLFVSIDKHDDASFDELNDRSHYDYQVQRGMGDFSDDENELTSEELTEQLRERVSPCLRDMFALMGKSVRSAITSSITASKLSSTERNVKRVGTSKTASIRAMSNILTKIDEARAEGKSEAELIAMTEQFFGKYFPEILARHEARMQKGVERKESVRVLVRDMKRAQLNLFDGE